MISYFNGKRTLHFNPFNQSRREHDSNVIVVRSLRKYFKNLINIIIMPGLFDRDVAVIEMALNRGIPCATVIGGGYDDDINILGRRHSIIHRAAIKVSERGHAS